MTKPRDTFDAVLPEMIAKIAELPDLHSREATDSIKNFKLFSEARPTVDPEPEPVPEPVIMTKKGRALAWLGRVVDNETARTVIKAGASIGGVAIVTYATIRRDHIIEKQALAQANQRQ